MQNYRIRVYFTKSEAHDRYYNALAPSARQAVESFNLIEHTPHTVEAYPAEYRSYFDAPADERYAVTR